MAKQKHFTTFLTNIEPSPTTISYISSVQNNLRDYLKSHQVYKSIHDDTFLSGSYAKHTCIRPVLNDAKRDVDIIVVTNYDTTANSEVVLTELKDILIEKDIYKTARIQSYSVGMELQGIEIDIVPVAVDNNGDYFIGSSSKNEWKRTDPRGHKEWSSQTNADSNKKYKPLVKMVKWWRRTHCPESIKYPKGITLEKIIADNLPSSDLNTETYLIEALNNIVSFFKGFLEQGEMPNIWDPSIQENDLLDSYSYSDVEEFVNKLEEHTVLLAEDGTTNDTWRTILGNEFPKDDSQQAVSALSVPLDSFLSVAHRQTPPWSITRGGIVMIATQVVFPDGTQESLSNNSAPIPKGSSLYYRAITGIKRPFTVKWQVVNTGNAAEYARCLRGGFEDSNRENNTRYEETAYTGKHYVQCFVLKNGRCIAKSKEFFINVE